MIFRLWTTFLLALLGACAVAWLAALMREKDIRPVQKACAFFKRQTKAGRVVLGTLFVAMWVIASTKPSDGGGNGGDEGGTNGVQMAVQPLVGLGGVLRPLGSPGGGGEALGEAATNEDWLAHGAFEDWFYVCPSNWWARAAGGGWIGSLRVFSSGGFEARGEDGTWRGYPPPFPRKLSVAPRAGWGMLASGGETEARSVFWHGATPSNTLLLTWQDALYARSHTNLVSFQAELFNDGSAAYRYGGPAATNDHVVPLVLPFDRDGDGLADEVDPDPDAAGPDAHGTNAEWYGVVCSNILQAAAGPDGPALSWREGVNSNAYYFVDVVAARGPAPIRFAGDRACRLGDPVVVALAGETNRVPLLIGVGYAVTSDTPFSVSFPVDYMYPAVETDGPCAARVRWPLGFEFSEDVTPSNRVYAASAVPYDPGGEFSWGMGGGGLSKGMPRSGGCGCVSYDGRNIVFDCSETCSCSGECAGSGTYDLEGASFAVTGGVCRCGFDDPDFPPSEWTGVARFFVSFSESAVIFEDAYEDRPGDWKPKRSTRVRVTVSAYGGPFGGSFTLATENLGKLTPVACGPMVFPTSMELGPHVGYSASFLCEGAEESGSADDVSISGTFVENETGVSLSGSNRLTVVRVEFKPDVHPPKEGASGRHKYGVCELVEHHQFPSAPAVTWNPVGGGSNTVSKSGKPCYKFPLYACEKPLRVELGDASYTPLLNCIEPSGIVTGKVDLCTYGLPSGKAGGIGLLQDMYVTPFDVSFSEIAVEEVPCDQGSVTGYFRWATPTNLWSHTRIAGAGKWRNVDVNNRVGGENDVRDEAALDEELLPITPDGILTNDYSCGWIDGLMVWQVPFGWNVRDTKGEAEPFKTFGTVTQEFYIDRWGQATVRKFGNRATRLLDDRRFLNNREVFNNEVRSK